MKIEVVGKENAIIELNEGENLYSLLKRLKEQTYLNYYGVKVNNKLQQLDYAKFNENDKVEFIDITNADGRRIYLRTLMLIYFKACKDLFHDANVTIFHSINKGLYTEITNKQVSLKELSQIKNRMQQIIDEEAEIKTSIVDMEEAFEIFKKQGMQDKIELFNSLNISRTRIYELDGYFDSFDGYLAPNTKFIDKFDIRLFQNGIVLYFPVRDNNYELPTFFEQNKLFGVYKESEQWGEIMEVGYVGYLNKKITQNTIDDMILVNEALHEKKIAYIADEITNSKNIKIVLIAGPSSSGKTTFANRLSVQLRVNGKKTLIISLDDYFVDRHLTPKDENGVVDFEALEAIDISLFKSDLEKIIACEEITLPEYNFKKGIREYKKAPIKLTDDYIIIIEGIHGLNDEVSSNIPKEKKFKIYISALTQLNLDNHNRISTSDLRLIRRIVRDNSYRGNDATKTMKLWDNVTRGNERYIFPYQENADAIFNSALVYELCVLKRYVEPLLMSIDENNEFYFERLRLLKILNYFLPIKDEKFIPTTSILREFIGKGCFE